MIVGRPIKKLKVDFDENKVNDAIDLNDALADLFASRDELNNENFAASIQAKIKQKTIAR